MIAGKRIDDLLADARSGFARLTAEQAYAAMQDGAVLVDVRPGDERRQHGGAIPGARHFPLSAALWRLDEVSRDTRIVLICCRGWSSSFAAAGLPVAPAGPSDAPG
ncbi:MAG TPA: rhodanese-like domain-containing protein [Gaiellaceae bacterium]|nr:rhodanese-like domain-containing protein [Gaiellaceae bacterium]